ncbi:hypothetical protein JOE58_001308 [Curtobacterium luteum]|uniref:Uncharacterized protein n=1 Tax=Curtobacterium luteum TaxID=33881 RepID=A0A8H9GE52_9MICO|nr:hypothetical protein [Curtobacterium luteum]MBM7802057.1 hypothetical protein [Curtobacterium luteum]NUU51331.1 hypothetical protein [Curtobacterium luteum]GGL09122.1 hypothetical protein GCM10009769_28910 [Curtobacterium luteum]
MTSIRDRGTRRRPLRTSLALVAALAVAVSGLTFGTVLAEQTTTESASAATASAFDPGNIISDANFYDGSAMSASSVQSFLNSVAPGCRQASGGPKCLKDFSQAMSAIPAVSGRCAAIASGTKTAATMIAQVGSACGISQKVLLVLLQKEQGIVTTSSPTSYMYLHATGFACPDTAPCDPAYYGFGQQVYAAALQFKRYQASPTSWAYQAGRNNSILYNPNSACGRKTVYIKNQATAGLYIYTPYTPNTAAMNNLYGTGDSCSAYGNRNFWRMYTDWFGSPTGNGSPYGNVDAVTASSASSYTVTGWAVDPDTTNALRVAFYIDGAGWKTVTANVARPDLAGSLGAGNTQHGFSAELTGVAPGAHSVCSYAINQGSGSNTLLGCYTRTITSAAPKGVIDTATGGPGTISAVGWALDPDSSKPASYKLLVDGTSRASGKTTLVRKDVAAVYPGVGTTLGWSQQLTGIQPGSHTVALYVVDAPGTGYVKVASKTVSVTAPSTGKTGGTGAVRGAYESATGGAGTITLKGWAIDPDVWDPVKYLLHVDGARKTGTADATRTDIEAKNKDWGSDVGLSVRLTGLSAGKHTVRVYYQDLPSATWVSFGTKTVTVTSATSTAPSGHTGTTGNSGTVTGAFESVSGGVHSATLRGWAIDPDVWDPVQYLLHVDGVRGATGTANAVRTDVEAVHPGWGSDVGLSVKLTGLTAGAHTVRVYFQDKPSGTWKSFGTKTVTVVDPPTTGATGKTGAVRGAYESATAGTGTVRLAGWAIDPDRWDPVRYLLHVDGVRAGSGVANAVRTDVQKVHPDWGSDVGLAVTLTELTPGKHTVRVYYEDLPRGTWVSFGTKTVTVK